MHFRVPDSEQRRGAPPLGALSTPTLEKNMMKSIRTRLESKRAASQTQSIYFWRPAPGRR